MSLFFDRAGLIAELRTSNLSSAIQENVVQQAVLLLHLNVVCGIWKQ